MYMLFCCVTLTYLCAEIIIIILAIILLHTYIHIGKVITIYMATHTHSIFFY